MANNNGSLPSSVTPRASNVSGNGQVLQNLSGRTNPQFNSSLISSHNGLTNLSSNLGSRGGNFEQQEVEGPTYLEQLAAAEDYAHGGAAPLRGPYNQVPRVTSVNVKEYPSLEIAMRNGLVPKGPSKKTRPKRKSRRSRKTRRRNNRR
jgi:hypothetical protein